MKIIIYQTRKKKNVTRLEYKYKYQLLCISGRRRYRPNTTANPNLDTCRDHVTQQKTKIRKPAPTTAPQADARAPHSAIIKFKAGIKKINAYKWFSFLIKAINKFKFQLQQFSKSPLFMIKDFVSFQIAP